MSTTRALRPPGAQGQTEAMHATDLDISKLSVAERIQLAEDLRDSVAAETGDLPLTEAQAAELDRRLTDLERDPEAGQSWVVVRARIEQRLDKASRDVHLVVRDAAEADIAEADRWYEQRSPGLGSELLRAGTSTDRHHPQRSFGFLGSPGVAVQDSPCFVGHLCREGRLSFDNFRAAGYIRAR